MAETLTSIPTDFYTDSGFLISINIPAIPHVGDTVVHNGEMYTIRKIALDFDVGGIPLLVRINVDG